MTANSLDYPRMVQDALRTVVHRSLIYVQGHGLPGDHHFYVAFATTAPGVGLSAELRRRYSEQMTVVLQHDFRDLEVESDYFAVTLRFGGVPQRIRVPYSSLISFYDPAAQFALRFDPDAESPGEVTATAQSSPEDTSSRAAVRSVLAAADRLAAEKEAAQRKIGKPGDKKTKPSSKRTSRTKTPQPASNLRPGGFEKEPRDLSETESSEAPAPLADNVVSIDSFRRK